ncbi:fibronectin type III domain-containing protein [Desulfoluna sp.]|uniref:fibronectin type III domain-containing protein n=1 Tax=Desulfoluna sp. TaxID=2045199 RepID=UPI002629BFAA|nr:fibronectin type III domain-containing protein [Desulfoluna sp.]
MNQCTIVNNNSGLYLDNTVAHMKNSILANASHDAFDGGGGTLTSEGYNLCDKPLTSFDQETDHTGCATLNVGDYDGVTHTHPLLAGSIAVDLIPEGDNGYNGAPATDQRGIKRPQGRGVDVGAYEMEPNPPSASPFTAEPIYQKTVYAFKTADFGYTGADSDPLDHVRIVKVPDEGTLWVDNDGSGSITDGESALSDGETVSLVALDGGKLLYRNDTGLSSFFDFDVNNGMKYSVSTYKATLIVISEPAVTLSQTPGPVLSEHGGTANIMASLSHTFNKAVTVNLSLSDTSTCKGEDYSVSTLSLVIPAGQASGVVCVTGLDDFFVEGDETLTFDLSSVINGVTSGTNQASFTLKDDDTAGMSLSKTEARVGESGISDSFTVALTSAPLSNVVIRVTSDDIRWASVSPASLTFTPANWGVPQTVVVTGKDDRILSGDKITRVTMAVVDSQSDKHFCEIAEGHVSVTIDDDEVGWTGGAGNNLWSDAGNWMHGVMPVDGDNVVLTGAGDDTILLDQAVTLNYLSLPESFAGTLVQGDVPLTIVGDFQMAGGKFTGSQSTITIGGDFQQAGGLFASTSGELHLSGDFNRSGGSFAAKGGSLVLTGTDQAISGSTTFYRLICLSSRRYTLRFEAGSTQEVENLLRLEGCAEKVFFVGSTNDNNAWQIRALGTVILDSLTVRDCHYKGAPAIVCGNSFDDGNNEGVTFVSQEPPCAIFTDLPAEPVNAETLSLLVGGIGVVSYRCQVNDGKWSDEVPIDKRLMVSLPEEPYCTIKIKGKSRSGVWQREDEATTAIVGIDRMAPTARLLDGPQGEVGRGEAAVRVCGDGVAVYQFSVDGGPWSAIRMCRAPLFLSDLTPGEHTLDVVGGDVAGNWQTKSSATSTHWAVNPALPAAILAGVPASFTQESNATITVMGAGAGMDEYTYALDDGPWQCQLADTPIELFDIDDGEHTLYVNAAIGDVWQGGGRNCRIGATTWHWTIDQESPVTPAITTATGEPVSSAIILSWSPQPGNDRYRVWYSDSEFSPDTLTQATELSVGQDAFQSQGTFHLAVEGLHAGTTYWFGIKSVDKAGNTSALSTVTSQTTTDIRPTISNVRLADGGAVADNSRSRELILKGAHFLEPAGTNLVRFSNANAAFDLFSNAGTPTLLRLDVPMGVPTGEYTLRILNKYGSSRPLKACYTVSNAPEPLPEVSEVTPILVIPGTETEMAISGSNFGRSVSDVLLVAKDGTCTSFEKILLESESCLRATLALPANFSAGYYSIRVVTESGLFNEVSAMQVEVEEIVDMASQTENIMTLHPVKVGFLPMSVKTTLTTDSRPESPGACVMHSKIAVAFEPGTRLEKKAKEEWLAYDGIVLPPRQIPVPEEIRAQLENGCLAFSLGSSQSLRLMDNRPLYMTMDVVLPEGSHTPIVYYVAPDNTMVIAGLKGIRNGIDIQTGGTILGVRDNTPEPGLMTWTIGLLSDHMSTYAIGTKRSECEPPSDSGSHFGPCFISAAKGPDRHSTLPALACFRRLVQHFQRGGSIWAIVK